MAKDLLNPRKALIFRIVHKDNVGRILSEGCLSRTAAKVNPGYVEIGNQELIQKRMGRVVPCGPGGTLSDYVPFYFTPYSPMLYNIKTGWGVPQRPVSEILILVSSLHFLKEQGIPFVFSDRHAYLKTAQFSDNLADLQSWIIWPALQQRDFRKDDADKFEKYQAEALVHNRMPMGALFGIVCYNDSVRAAVQAEADQRGVGVKIVAKPKWYL
ncbi:MAG: type II toxin-antitoxin system toxin DNA ADP-ribosyl transferase DarT [Propylenella sp.]